MPRRPLSRAYLHDLAIRRRDDQDSAALLHEIRRLHEAMADLYDLMLPLPKVNFSVQEVAEWKRLAADMLLSRSIVRPQGRGRRTEPDPSLPDTSPPGRWKPRRSAPTETEGERAAKLDLREARRLCPSLTDEAALKRLARDRRG
jgi:hypothetical protein